MKKLITLLFAIAAIALVSCNSGETKKDAKTDSTTVCADSTAKVDTCKMDTTCPKVKEVKDVKTPVVKK